MSYRPVESFIIQRLEEGGWRVIHCHADLTDAPIADFVSRNEADEWVNWKSGLPKINPYARADAAFAPMGLVEIAIEPKSEPDAEALRIALARLATQDPTLRVSTDRESGQTILKGMSELQLDSKLDILKRTYDIDARVGAPQVGFRERVTRLAEVAYTYKRQSGGAGEFAGVTLRVEPNEPGGGYQFESNIVGDAIPSEYLSGVVRGIESVLPSGVVAGFPVIDVKVALIDGKYHDIDSSVRAFEIAARVAFRKALQKAKSVLLEPIMKVEVVTPDDNVRSIVSDLKRRGGRIQGQDALSKVTVVSALVPLMNMFGYVNSLRSISHGRASFTMRFDHYAPAPPQDDPPFAPAIGMHG